MPTISCTEFSRRLDEAVERRESLDTVWLREHAAACAECRGLWLDARTVDHAVAQWKKPVPAAGLTDRILGQVAADSAALAADVSLGVEKVPAKQDREQITPVPRRRINRTVGAAITAVALLVSAGLFFNRPRQQSAAPIVRSGVAHEAPRVVAMVPQPKLVAKSEQTSAPTKPLPNTPTPVAGAPVELMVADAGSAYLHLAGDAAKAVTAASVLVPSAETPEETPADSKSDDEPWVDGMRREIAPVTHQLSHAFEFLIQAVPEKRAPAT